jgi:hypothetical protein
VLITIGLALTAYWLTGTFVGSKPGLALKQYETIRLADNRLRARSAVHTRLAGWGGECGGRTKWAAASARSLPNSQLDERYVADRHHSLLRFCRSSLSVAL